MQTDAQRRSRRLSRRVGVLAIAGVLLLPVQSALGVCGDVTNNSAVDAADIAAIRAVAAGLLPGLVVPENCNVIGPTDGSDADGNGLPDDCNMADVVVLRRAAAGLPPGLADVCCDAPSAFDVAGECCPRERINCGIGLCQPIISCRNGACSGGACRCDPGWVSQSCTAPCSGGAGPAFCGAPACSGHGQCINTPSLDIRSLAWDCYGCQCDELYSFLPFGGKTCQFWGIGVDTAGTTSFETDLESLYVCEPPFFSNCNTLPVDFADAVPELEFTIEFMVRRRGNWIGGMILKKWGCSRGTKPLFCDPAGYTANWAVEIGDPLAGVPGGKVRFGVLGNITESNVNLELADGGLDLWHHVAITYDCCDPATSGITFIIDGRFDSFHSKAVNGNFFNQRNRGNLYVADDHRTAGPIPANLDLDEIRIWNVKRTQEEIVANMDDHIDLSDPNTASKLIYYLRFGESCEEANTDGITEYANGWSTRIVGDFLRQHFSPVFDPNTVSPTATHCVIDPL